MYDFDQIIERRGTGCEKYDFALENGKPEGLLPLWVADMDFCVPQEVKDSLHSVVEHGIFGYTEAKGSYYKAAAGWLEKHFGWRPMQEWLVRTPGVVFAIAAAIRAFTSEGESVLIQQPVYYPFAGMVRKNKRNLVVSPLVYTEGRYQMDFEDFEQKIIRNQVKLFVLCSPHNPVGRVWSREELKRVGDICLRHHVLVVSDEIHCDFTYPGYTHTIFASLGKDFADNSIICTAPSKTFNLAGLQASNIWIADANIRRAFADEVEKCGYFSLNLMAIAACEAAYRYGEQWLNELKTYLKENLDFVREYLRTQLPQIHLVEPEGTYLVWLNCKGLGLTSEELDQFIVEKAGLWLDGGTMFGSGGEQFQRLNIACPRSVLKQAFDQLKSAVGNLRP